MKPLRVYLEGISVLGPAMPDWNHARQVLSARDHAYEPRPMHLPVPELLPSSERRRAGDAIKLSMAAAVAAVRDANADAAQLANVFSSTGGDCENCHNILETLASGDRLISPTRFHNSVHNAPAGYWSIATGCMAASTSLSAYDAGFSVGLLEAATQTLASGERCLLVAFDTKYPAPLYAVRPIPHYFAVGFVLNASATAMTKATLDITLCGDRTDNLADAQLEHLRRSVPTARALPLLQLLANSAAGRVVIEYLDPHNLAVEVRV
ncbi:MAG: beta-ketoacyl synthase chain length factor [Spongiibacteraceae bacterium]